MTQLALSLPQLGLSIAAGGLTTLSPCVFPMLPLGLGGAAQGHRLAAVAMSVDMTASFAALGTLLGALGPALGIDGDTVRTAGAAMLIAFALVMLVPALGERFSRWMLPIASAAHAASARLDGRSLLSAAALCAVLGLACSPCSGPLLGSALTLVASDGDMLRGGVVLALFGLGAALPLVALGLCVAQRLRPRARLGAGAHRAGTPGLCAAAGGDGRGHSDGRRQMGRSARAAVAARWLGQPDRRHLTEGRRACQRVQSRRIDRSLQG